MPDRTPNPPSPLAAFLSAFRADIEADAIRPLSDYLARFPGDEAAIEREYRAAIRQPSEVAREPAAGRIGPYRILGELGRGGQGVVYLAEDTTLGRNVALKVLESGVSANPEALARFRREAAITSKLDNPGICPVYSTGEDRGSFWIAMRHVEGESLSAKISTAKAGLPSGITTFVTLPERGSREEAPPRPHSGSHSGPKTWTEIGRLLALFEHAARTLHVAHEAGVIHRDIKPGNMIVTKTGDPVILDFGLAQDIGGDQTTLTITGDLMGTPAYMSPEQIAAKRITLDRRTDVYSLGISLFECLTLHRPFDAPTRVGLYQAIMTKEPPDLRSLNPAIPADLRVVVATAIEKDRDRRYQTALDFAEELRRVRMHEPIIAKPVGPLARLRRWAQRSPALAAALVGLFVVLATGLTIALVLLDEARRERDAKNTERWRADQNAASRDAALIELRSTLKLIQAALIPAVLERRAREERSRLITEDAPDRPTTLPQRTLRSAATPGAPITGAGAQGLPSLALLRAITLHKRGKALQAGGDHQAALTRFEEAAATLEGQGQVFESVAVLDDVADELVALGRYDDAVATGEKGIARLRTLQDETNLAAFLNNHADRLYRMKRFDAARIAVESSLQIKRREGFSPDSLSIGLSVLGKILRTIGSFEEARKTYEQALAIDRRHGSDLDVALTSHNVGWCLLDLSRFDEARPFFEDSVKILRAATPVDPSLQMLSLIGLCDCYSGVGRAEDALRCAREATATFVEFSRPDSRATLQPKLNK